MTLSEFITYAIAVPFAAGVGMFMGGLSYQILKYILDRREATSDEIREAMIASYATCFVALIIYIIVSKMN